MGPAKSPRAIGDSRRALREGLSAGARHSSTGWPNHSAEAGPDLRGRTALVAGTNNGARKHFIEREFFGVLKVLWKDLSSSHTSERKCQ